jgi:hypothetical protein
MSQYESSTGESLPPPSVVGSTSSVGGDDELDDEVEYETRQRVRVAGVDAVADADDEEGIEYRMRKRRRKEDEAA